MDAIQPDDLLVEISDLKTQLESTDDVNKLASTYASGLTAIVDKLAPTRQVMTTKRPKFPWLTDQSNRLKRYVRRCERRWLYSKQPSAWKEYTQTRNLYSRHLWYNKMNKITEHVFECKNDSRKLYKLVNNLTGRILDNPMPVVDDPSELPDMFANFFLSKIHRIRDNLADIPIYCPRTRSVEDLDQFSEVSEEDILKVVMSMQTKSCELDPLPAQIFKKFIKELTPVITHVVNASIGSCIFPIDWKSALVKPLLKKHRLENIQHNYRPVSNLSSISKITEKVVLRQIVHHMDEFAPLPEYQSAYRANHGCETAIVELHNDILWNMEKAANNGPLHNGPECGIRHGQS